MSKISPMQAAALGIKTNLAKPELAKPAPKQAVVKPAVTKAVIKPSSKPALKPAAKQVAKPKVDHTKKDKKNDLKDDQHNNNHKHDSKKDDKKLKSEKVKMERDSFTMPKDEYAQLTLLKARLTTMGQPAKKSELLRAGIKLLAAMSDNTLKTTLAKIPVIKTGRPNK